MSNPVSTPVGGLLAAFVNVPPEIKADFDLWYDTEHMPERLEVPGFLSAARFEAVDGSPRNLALYELTSPDEVKTEKYIEVRGRTPSRVGQRVWAGWKDHLRITYTLRSTRGSERIATPYIMTVQQFVIPGSESVVREWLDAEHAVVLLTPPGAVSYHGLEPVDPPFHFLNVWGLENPEVPNSDAWRIARDTPWREEVRRYFANNTRTIYRRAGPTLSR